MNQEQRRQQIIREAALKLCDARGQDPFGKVTLFKSEARYVKTSTFVLEAERDVITVLDSAVPGFLDGKVEILSTEPPTPEEQYR